MKDFEHHFRILLEKETNFKLKDDLSRLRHHRDHLNKMKENKFRKDQFDVINRILVEESKRDP